MLKLIISAKGIQIWLSTVGLIGPAKLTQSKKSIGGEVVNLNIKLLKYFMQELNGGKAKAIGKEVLENDSIILTRLRYRLAL